MLPEDRTRIEHMIQASEEALTFAAGRQRADLDRDRMLALALTRAVEIVGEAASHVSLAVRESSRRYRGVSSSRNRLVHAYLEVDNGILWTTVVDRLPELVVELRQLLVRGNDSSPDD